jgi:predicted metal-dependent peptidase
MQEAKQALSKAKIELMSRPDSLFFTLICFGLKHLWDSSIPTACTNGSYIKFNPEFFMSLSKEERVFLLLHETLHVAFMHMVRMAGLDAKRWNYAADYVINDILIKQNYKMPKGGLHDIKYRGMHVKQVYDLLENNMPPEEPALYDLISPDGDEKEAEQVLQDIIVRASIQAKQAGDDGSNWPDDIKIYLDGLFNPKLPWKTILQRYVQHLAKNDYSYRKPNRRYFPKYHLPSLYSETLMDIAIAVDTSGSVSDADFKQVLSEVNTIFRCNRPQRITFIQFDYQIKQVDFLNKPSDLLSVTFSGRGGTLITPVIEWAKKNKPQLLLVFTDGEFYDTDFEPPTGNTLWLIHNNAGFTTKTGKVIHYEMTK